MRPTESLQKCWLILREITGDDAYERYLAHWGLYHSQEDGSPLSREAFFKQALERKWNGVKRCC
ncbi:MAG: YbdD/YjiX family protein [Methylococcaceae bacterium]|nr:YbdD/YjiX family protein [Methylococcaceae bacterium]